MRRVEMSFMGTGMEEYGGTCFEVVDGDTMKVRTVGGSESLRLARVDAPELDAPGGQAAKQLLESLVLGRHVRYTVKAHDTYGRLIAKVWVGNVHVNKRMRQAGYAN
jgi:micrococcal nuclease